VDLEQYFELKNKTKKGLVALKVIETKEKQEMNEGLLELTNLSRLKNNENVLPYEKFFLNTVLWNNESILYQIFIEMELGDSNLAQLLLTMMDQKLSTRLYIDYFKQICNGILFSHGRQCAHLDLKPENVILFGNKCKIADWGGSLQLKSEKSTKICSHNLAVSVGFVAPEIEDERYGSQEKFNYYACDIYSLGILGFKLLGITRKEVNTIPRNKKLYHDETINEFVGKLKSEHPVVILELLRAMSSFEVGSRPNIQKVCEIVSSFN